jgi:DNA primase
VLPEARAGREIRFLFLPDAEDPDSLVGREGGAAFEARLATALPLSEYLVAQLSSEADISHADGKARFVALARPLLEKVTPGVYRELLVERLAAAIGTAPSRLQQWLAPGAGGAAAPPRGASSGRGTGQGTGLGTGQRTGHLTGGERVGRGSLVTQAIALLLHCPAAAAAVGDSQREALAQIAHPGVAVLRELLEELRTRPARSMAQTLERWRERPEYARLCELAASAPLVGDAPAASRELAQAIERLLDATLRGGRLEALIDKARAQALDEAEKLELQALTTGLSKTESSFPAR